MARIIKTIHWLVPCTFLASFVGAGNAVAACQASTHQITFRANSSYLDDRAKGAILEMSRDLGACQDNIKVHVFGYASPDENSRLAISRAAYVRDLLMRAGVSMAALSSLGKEGIAPGHLEADNQVVVIQVDRIQEAQELADVIGSPATTPSRPRPAPAPRLEKPSHVSSGKAPPEFSLPPLSKTTNAVRQTASAIEPKAPLVARGDQKPASKKPEIPTGSDRNVSPIATGGSKPSNDVARLTGNSSENEFRTANEARQRKDFKTALLGFESLATKGNANAIFNIGTMYFAGEGVKKDEYEAFEYYSRACGLGQKLACFNSALMLRDNFGTHADITKSQAVLKKLCLESLTRACDIFKEVEVVSKTPLDTGSYYSMDKMPGRSCSKSPAKKPAGLYPDLLIGGYYIIENNGILSQQYLIDNIYSLKGGATIYHTHLIDLNGKEHRDSPGDFRFLITSRTKMIDYYHVAIDWKKVTGFDAMRALEKCWNFKGSSSRK